MSKAPSFSPIRYNPNKKIERLYFPQYGDRNLYAEGGKKHYSLQQAFKAPYAQFTGEEYCNDLLKQKLLDDHSVAPSQAYSNRRQYQESRQLKRVQQLSQRQQHKPAQKQYLEQQIDSFNIKRELYKKLEQQQRRNQYERQKRAMRVKTQNTAYFTEEPPQLPKRFPLQINFDNPVKERMKTEVEYPSINRQKMRFNPTFLSSLNY